MHSGWKYFLGFVAAMWLRYFILLCATVQDINSNIHCCVLFTNTTTYYGDCTDAFFADTNLDYLDWSQRLHNLCVGGFCYLSVLAVLLGLVVKFGEGSDETSTCCDCYCTYRCRVLLPGIISIVSALIFGCIMGSFFNGNDVCGKLLPKQAEQAHLVETFFLFYVLAPFFAIFSCGFLFVVCWVVYSRKSEPDQVQPDEEAHLVDGVRYTNYCV